MILWVSMKLKLKFWCWMWVSYWNLPWMLAAVRPRWPMIMMEVMLGFLLATTVCHFVNIGNIVSGKCSLVSKIALKQSVMKLIRVISRRSAPYAFVSGFNISSIISSWQIPLFAEKNWSQQDEVSKLWRRRKSDETFLWTCYLSIYLRYEFGSENATWLMVWDNFTSLVLSPKWSFWTTWVANETGEFRWKLSVRTSVWDSSLLQVGLRIWEWRWVQELFSDATLQQLFAMKNHQVSYFNG